MTQQEEQYGVAIARLRKLLDAVSREEFLEKTTPWVPERWALSEGFAYRGRSKRRKSGEMLDGLALRRPFVESLAQTALTRSTVRQIVRDAGENGDHLANAFVAVMAWGFPARKFGPYRTSVMLTPAVGAPDPIDVLPRVVGELSRNGPLGGYKALMNKLEGCGPAFGTKFLYFASDDSNRAPILDEVVARWMADKKVTGENGKPITSRGWNVRNYENYLKFLRHVAAQLGEPDVGLLEYVMFVDQQHHDYLAAGQSLPAWIGQVPR